MTIGQAYYLTYTVREDENALAQQGYHYTVSYSDNGEGVLETTADDPLLITNDKEEGSLSIVKQISDGNAAGQTFTFEVELKNNDSTAYVGDVTVTDSTRTEPTVAQTGSDGKITVTVTGEGTATISKIPVGTTYTVTEPSDRLPEGWTQDGEIEFSDTTKTIAANDEDTATVTNKYEQTGSLKITKAVTIDNNPISGDMTDQTLADGTYTFGLWKIKDPAAEVKELEEAVKADGTSIGTLQITITNGVATPSALTVDGLAAGTYVVKETASTNNPVMIKTDVEGYDNTLGGIVVTVKAGDTSGVQTAAFTNNYETTQATVKKVWAGDGTPPSSLQVALVKNGVVISHKVTLSDSNDWTATVTDLPKYNNGEMIIYTWLEEDLPDGYFLTGTTAEGTITTLTNTYQTYNIKTSYVGIKTWSDDENRYSTRPNQLIVTLYASYYDPVTDSYGDPAPQPNTATWEKDSATNQWTYTFNDLPVFDENGNIIKYSAQEEEPKGYTGETTSTPTTYNIGEISWSDVKQRVTPGETLTWNLGSLIDVSFVAIKTTGNNPTVVWTNRVPTPYEKEQIRSGLVDDGKLPGCNPSIVWYSGHSGTIDTGHGSVTVEYDETNLSVTLEFGSHDSWSQYVYGQFNKEGSSEYDIGTTEFTNTLETTELEGQKIWSISGTEVPENPTLTLTRTIETTTGEGDDAVTTTSAPEPVQVKQGGEMVDLQPTWNGEGMSRSFKYAGLPKYDENGNEYTYSVSEAKFTIGSGDDAVTYTVTKNSDGTYTVTSDPVDAPKFVVNQSVEQKTEGDETKEITVITNTEMTDFEFSKVWIMATAGAGNISTQSLRTWPDEKSITVRIFRKNNDTNTAREDEDFELVYEISDSSDPISPTSGKINGQELTEDDKAMYQLTVTKTTDGKIITFKTGEVLEKSANATEDWVYYVEEKEVSEGYSQDGYGTMNTTETGGTTITKAPGAAAAADCGVILNRESSGYELPETGGIGTTLFTALGGLMTVTAGAILTMRRGKRKPMES